MLVLLFFINVVYVDMMWVGIVDERQVQVIYQYFVEVWILLLFYGFIVVGVVVYVLFFFLEWKMLIGKDCKDF